MVGNRILAHQEKLYRNSSSSREDQKLHIPAMDCDENCKKTNNKIAVNCDDGFVSLNVVELIAATDPHHSPISPAPATPSAAPVLMKKSLSRKLGVAGPPQRSAGSQAVVGAHAGGTNYRRDKPPDEGEASAAGAGGRCRRASAVHRPSPWRDPRTILLLFASLSCMGTLILLYFTISMGRTSSTVDAR